MLQSLFLLTPPPAELLLVGRNQPGLVLLSVLIAVLSSGLALQMTGIAGDAASRSLRQIALLLGSLSLGAGVWSMHFIGMLAFQICTPVHYRLWPTLASMVPSLGAAFIALFLLARPRVSRAALLAGGSLVGAGIGLMHYQGMAAMALQVDLRYDPLRFAISIAVAVALAVLALWVRYELAQKCRLSRRRAELLGALVMGAAISGMHYSAMGAARFIGRPAAGFVPATSQNSELAFGIALITLVIGVLTAGINAALRFRQVFQTLQASEARLQATLEERSVIQAALAESELQHRSLIANIPGVAFRCIHDPVQGSYRLAFISEACAELTGWSSAELMAGAVAYADLIHPDDRARVLQHAGRFVDGRGSYRLEYRVLTRQGVERWVAESGTASRGHADGLHRIDGIVLDMTESRLRNAEFEGVVTALRRGVAVIEFDLQGSILAVNRKFLELTGYQTDELLGQAHALLTRNSDSQAVKAARQRHWDALRRGEYRTAEFRLVGKDGRKLWIQATYNPILDADGVPMRVLTFVTDLSERRAMEIDLREAKERAEQAAAAKSSFLANISHEIRTPMNAIIGLGEVVLEGRLDEAQRAHVGTIHRAARTLLALLNDVLDTARLEHGAIELEARDFSLRELLSDLLATLRPGAEGKGLFLHLDYPVSVAIWWLGDPLRVHQILLNVIGNAVKFTERGGVTVRVRLAAPGLEIEVVDSGIGIAADRLERIFEPFAQADASMSRRFGGSGLGTSIARQLAQRMGGSIEVESTLGVGSCFRVALPLPIGQAMAGDSAAAARLPPFQAPPDLRLPLQHQPRRGESRRPAAAPGADLRSDLRTATAALRRGELDDLLLRRVSASLPAAAAAELATAIEDFDFERACACLDLLLESDHECI